MPRILIPRHLAKKGVPTSARVGAPLACGLVLGYVRNDADEILFLPELNPRWFSPGDPLAVGATLFVVVPPVVTEGDDTVREEKEEAKGQDQ